RGRGAERAARGGAVFWRARDRVFARLAGAEALDVEHHAAPLVPGGRSGDDDRPAIRAMHGERARRGVRRPRPGERGTLPHLAAPGAGEQRAGLMAVRRGGAAALLARGKREPGAGPAAAPPGVAGLLPSAVERVAGSVQGDLAGASAIALAPGARE